MGGGGEVPVNTFWIIFSKCLIISCCRCMGFAVGLSSGVIGLCVGRVLYMEFFHVITDVLYLFCFFIMCLSLYVIDRIVSIQFSGWSLQKVHFSYPYICYAVLMGAVGCTCLLFPETSGKPLPDLVRSRHRMISMKEVTRLSSAWDAPWWRH